MTQYAIIFDLDSYMLEQTFYKNTPISNAYKDIESVLAEHGFKKQTGNIYFGDETVNAVVCATTTIELTQKYDWFTSSVKNIRMLRIEDNEDLTPVINSILKKSEGRKLKLVKNI